MEKRQDIEVFFRTELKEEEHCQRNIIIVYALKGKVEVQIEDNLYHLSEEDFVLINVMKRHSMRTVGKALVCIIVINYDSFLKASGLDYGMFWCNSTVSNDMECEKIRYILGQLLVAYAEDKTSYTLMFQSVYYRLLDELVKNFMLQYREKRKDEETFSDEEIIDFVQSSYNQPITLKQVADKAFMSESSFSRYFKKLMGKNFLKYVNQLRMQAAVEDILYTDKNMTAIALDNGFSSSSTFSREFRNLYQMSPVEYKKSILNREELSRIEERKRDNLAAQQQLEEYLDGRRFQEKKKNQNFKCVEADATYNEKFQKFTNLCLNFGNVSDLLGGQMQEHLLLLKKKLDFKYVRVCDPFGPLMHLISFHDAQKMNFDKTDIVFDFLVDQEIYPIISLNFKPKQICARYNQLLLDEGWLNYFVSLEEWEAHLKKYLQHIIVRYGEEQILNWMFELNEDEYISQDIMNYPYTYAELWDVVAKVMKEYIPEGNLGGMGCSTFYMKDKLVKQLERWKTSTHQPDFFSIRCFPYVVTDIKGRKNVKPMQEEEFLKVQLQQFRQLISEMGYLNIPVFVTDYNETLSDRNYYNDSCGKAARVLFQMNRVGNLTDMVAYSTASDTLSQFFDAANPFIGALGLLSKDGIVKPIGYAYEFMEKVGNYKMASGDNYLVTLKGKNQYTVLAFHPKKFGHNYYLKEENEILVSEIPDIFENNHSLFLHFSFLGLQDGLYQLKYHRVNEQHGNALNAWEQLDYVKSFSRDDLSYLKNISIPMLQIEKRRAEHGKLEFDLELMANEVIFVDIRKSIN